MTEPMSSERLAEIRETLAVQQSALRMPRTTQWMARELLAEVDRLLTVQAELQQLTVQLGEAEVWWTVGRRDDERIAWDHRMTEEDARRNYEIRDRDGSRHYALGARLVGQWREVKETDD